MRQRFLVSLLLLVFCCGCTTSTKEDTPITWKQDEDEIVFYVYLSSEASAELMEMLNEPVTFEQVSEFIVRNTGGEIPFTEGALVSAAIVAKQDEVRTEMAKKISSEGSTLEIIGFKENPIKITEGALDLDNAPKDLADFEPQKNHEIVNALIDMMSRHGFVVEVYGRFTEP